MKKLLALFLFFWVFSFVPSFSADQYPKIDVSGFKKWEYKDVKVDPMQNYFLGLTQLGGYSPNSSGSPWQERLQLTIMGQLNEKLSVAYDVEQQPDIPDKYDVKVNYDNKHQLVFGDFNATFSGNEFASTTKYLNGVLITSKDTNYDFIAVPSAKLKSQIQNLTSQKGNNTKGPYSLGHGSIVEGSERIELNDILLTRGTDYIIDYFEGKVTFSRILTSVDEFKYSYEYTNLLDLFFPSLSKKDFFGVQGRYTINPDKWGVETPVPKPVSISTIEVFPIAARYASEKVVVIASSQKDEEAFVEIDEYMKKFSYYKKLSNYYNSLKSKVKEASKKKNNLKVQKLRADLKNLEKNIKKTREELSQMKENLSKIFDYKTIEPLIKKKQEEEKIKNYKKNLYQKQGNYLKNKKWDEATNMKKVIEVEDIRLNAIKTQIQNIEKTLVKSGAVSFEAVAKASDATGEATKISIEDDILEEEASGRYRVSNFPIAPFSETVTFKGTVLNKNEDYIIKYEEGLITLLLPILPSDDDPLKIDYSYFVTGKKVDQINGTGTRFYDLAQSSIVPKSERVELDGKALVRDFDYFIDYDAGKITFNYNVSNTSLIKAYYDYKELKLPPAPPEPKNPRSLTVGMTYLKESAKKSSSTTSTDYVETRKGSDIKNSDNTIYLSKFPLVPSSEGGSLVVSIDGKIATYEVNYVVPTSEIDPTTGYAKVIPPTKLGYMTDRGDPSDGYATGTIKILSTIESTSEVTILYSYYKSVIGRYTGSGNGSRGPYYIRNFRNIIPGTERIEVWTTGSTITDVYIRNSSFEADAGDKGYAINYIQDNPYITFNKELDPTQNYSIYFQYVAPQDTSSSGDISQDLTGFDASFKIGDILQFDGNYAKSRNDQIINAASTSETISTFTTPTSRVALSNKPVIDGSEKVYVNNFLRNKDIDYFIDYTNGSITFYYITLATLDSVTVDYQYQSLLGGVTTANEKSDSAYKYGVKSTVGKVSMAYSQKEIGLNFSPLGGTAIGVGSNYKDFSLGLAPVAHNFQSTYNYTETNNPIGTTGKFFTRNYNRAYTMGVNPFQLANIAFGYTNQEVRGDPSTMGGPVTSDSSLNTYSLTVDPQRIKRGVFDFSQKYDLRRSLSEDRVAKNKGLVEYGHLNYGLGFTDRAKFSFDYQLSEPKTYSTLTGETVSNWKLSRDNAYDVSLDLTFAKLQKLTTYAKVLNHQELNLLSTDESAIQTKNTTYRVDFIPISMLSTSYDYSRQENQTVIVNGKNPRTDRTATNMRLTPHPAIAGNWGYSEDFTILETARESSGRSNTYSIDWVPISLEKLKLGTRYNLYNRMARTPSGTFEVLSDNKTFNQDYNLTLTPIPIISLTPGFVQEDYYYASSTATSELRAVNQIVKCKASYKPMDVLNIDADYNLKVTTNLNDNINRHKSLINIRAAYKVFTWGELVYNLEDENNQGEIQAGGTLPDIDYLKTTNSINFNFNIPQDNPILSGVLLTASYKLTKFENKLRPTDNLFAYLINFEGTLNF